MVHVVVADQTQVTEETSSVSLSAKLSINLSNEQKQYLAKLKSATGRQVVPINLRLYRELLNLDLIVDKGRRLALSKLGNEVIRFL